MSRARRYAQLSSAVRCFKADLLQRHQIERLAEAGSLSETTSLLAAGQLSSSGTELSSVEAHLFNRVFDLTKRLISYAPPASKPLLKLSSAKYEFECAKQVLKSILYQVDAEEALKHIIPAGRFAIERCKELIEARDTSRVIDTFGDEALKRFISPKLTGERDGVAVVSAVDRYYYSRLWALCNLCDLLDAQVARALIGEMIDHMNILVAFRSRLFGLDRKSTSELLIPVNYHLGNALTELAETGSLPNIIGILDSTPYAHPLEATKISSDESLGEVELALSRSHLATCLNMFAGSPFHIGLALSFLIIKNYELHDLFRILNGKANNVPSERVLSSLILRGP